jgi:hypothetical protein
MTDTNKLKEETFERYINKDWKIDTGIKNKLKQLHDKEIKELEIRMCNHIRCNTILERTNRELKEISEFNEIIKVSTECCIKFKEILLIDENKIKELQAEYDELKRNYIRIVNKNNEIDFKNKKLNII